MDQSATYNDRVVRQFAVMTVVWGIVGMLVGVWIAAQLIWPNMSMDRRDIANYLGITIETVSRTLSTFQRNKVIEVHGKQIRILDRRALECIARPGSDSTTRSADESSQSTG